MVVDPISLIASIVTLVDFSIKVTSRLQEYIETADSCPETFATLLANLPLLKVGLDAIQKKVAEHFDIRLADMTSRRRPQNVAFPRQVAMFLSRTLTDRSLMDIGETFGGRDHGTVMHACKLIEKRMNEDQRLRQTVAYLQQVLQR